MELPLTYVVKEEAGKFSDLPKVPELNGTRSFGLRTGIESDSIIHGLYNLEKANESPLPCFLACTAVKVLMKRDSIRTQYSAHCLTCGKCFVSH